MLDLKLYPTNVTDVFKIRYYVGRYTIVYFIQQKETNYRQLLVTYVPDTNEQSSSH